MLNRNYRRVCCESIREDGTDKEYVIQGKERIFRKIDDVILLIAMAFAFGKEVRA